MIMSDFIVAASCSGVLATTSAPARPSTRGGAASTTSATSGRSSQMEFDLCAPESASLKMSKDTFRWDSPQSSATWKSWVTRCRGEYSARRNAVRLTSESGCSSWPTVTANEDSYRIGGDSQQSKCLAAMARRGEMSGQAAQDSLSMHGSRQGWSTPTATDASAMSPEMRPSRIATNRTTDYLARQVQWATPIQGAQCARTEWNGTAVDTVCRGDNLRRADAPLSGRRGVTI